VSVCPIVTTVNSGKTTEMIEMPLQVVGLMGQKYQVLDGGSSSSHSKGKILARTGGIV